MSSRLDIKVFSFKRGVCSTTSCSRLRAEVRLGVTGLFSRRLFLQRNTRCCSA